jgi:uncharacterized membrane protein YfcA
LISSTTILVTIAVFLAALLFASAGHSGASAYLAILGLAGFTPEVMKPTALALNVVVASIASYKFGKAGYFSWRLFWPFAAASIPMAFLGGTIPLTGRLYSLITGAVLFYAAYRMITTHTALEDDEEKPPQVWLALLIGGTAGFVGGLIGMGGGVFLSPILLLMGWAGPLAIAGTASVFILVNSVSGLLGHWATMMTLPPEIPLWGLTVLIGGWIGATYGSQHFSGTTVRRILGTVIFIASLKMLIWG